jgi:hep/hag repeat protein
MGVAVGFDHYHGKTATALGAYYRPNRDVQFNVGTVVGNDNQVFNGGLSFKVGPESKTAPSSTDARIAQLEKRIQELEQAKNK